MSTRHSARRAAAALVLATMAIAACGAQGSTGSPAATDLPGSSPSGAPSVSPTGAPSVAVLLKVTSEGGFIAPSASLAALPAVEVSADGRIFTPARPSGDNPDPLITGIDVRVVGASGAAEIAAAIRAAGLDRPAASEDPGIAADSGTMVFRVDVDGTVVTTRFAANGPAGPGLPGGGDNPARSAALDLLSRLLDPSETWGAATAETKQYTPAGYRVFAAAGTPSVDPSAGGPSVGWPLAGDLASFGSPAVPDRRVPGLRSGVILGSDAQTLAEKLGSATATTPVESAGVSYELWVRPLLPDELGA